MLHMPRILILHETPLALAQDGAQQRRHVRLVAQVLQRREQRLEVEHDRAGERQPAQGLPVDAQVDAREREVRRLGKPVRLVRVAGRHEERGVELEAPGAALDGARGGEFGEVAGAEEGRGVSC